MRGLRRLSTRGSATLALLGGLAVLAGCSSDTPEVASDLGPAGNGVCLKGGEIDHTEVIDDGTILFVMKDGKAWLNALRFACSGLQLERGFDYIPEPGQVCSNQQTIRVSHTGNLCELGQFVPAPVIPK